MSACVTNIRIINETECLSESLNTINTNFETLSSITCELKERVESIRMSRTFYYYGPNSDIISYTEENNQLPSDFTISTFVNSPNELDLHSISYPGDIVYIVYQRTGVTLLRNNVKVPFDASGTFTTAPISTDVGINRRRFLPASTFLLNEIVQNQTTTNPNRSQFTYKRINETGRVLDLPIYTPRTILNTTAYKGLYTAAWEVTDARTANMPVGTYTFSFGLNSQESISFQNRMQTWLISNIGHHDVNITGDIIVSGESSYRTIRRAIRRGRTTVIVPEAPDTNLQTVVPDLEQEITPVFYIWKLTYEDRPGRGLNYYINNGWPKIHRAQTPELAGANWNQPQNWTTYNSW